MIKYVEADLFEHIKTIDGDIVIPHVCNNQGAWGKGFVIPLAQNYPQAREAYLKWHKNELIESSDGHHQTDDFDLGETQFVRVGDESRVVIVANMVAQVLGGERPLRYNHLATCMNYVAVANQGYHIVAPMFGAGLAGGDWNFIEDLIEDCWGGHDVTICYLKQFLPKNWELPKEN